MVAGLRFQQRTEAQKRCLCVFALIPYLEHELQPELDDARIACVRMRTRDAPKPSATYIRVWIVEVHLVENVQEFDAELQVYLLSDTAAFEESHIQSNR